MDKVLKQAIGLLGGEIELARVAGVSRQAVHKWTRIPPVRVLAIEKATGIPREVLRPDIYPPNDGRAAE